MKIISALIFQLFFVTVFAQKTNYGIPESEIMFPLSVTQYDLYFYGNVKSVKTECYKYTYEETLKEGRPSPVMGDYVWEDFDRTLEDSVYVADQINRGVQYFFNKNKETVRIITFENANTVETDIEFYGYNIVKSFSSRWDIHHITTLDTAKKVVTAYMFGFTHDTTQLITTYKGNFIPLKESTYKNGGCIRVKEWTYDESGHLISYTERSSTTATERKMKYHNQQLIQVDEYRYTNDMLTVHDRITATYKAKTVEAIHGKCDVKTGKLLTDDLTYITYDLNKNILYRKHTFTNHSETYTYDTAGNMILFVNNNGEGSIEKYAKTYNRYNDLIKEDALHYENDETTYEYVYDGKGNWIVRLEYNKGLIISRTTRQIEYY